MQTTSERVAAQYERYSYPPPLRDLSVQQARSQTERADPKYFSAYLFPEGPPRRDLRILSAGCGSNQAAHLAYNNPNATVVGIDLSEASLANQRHLANKHGLKNLRVEKRNILDVGQMSERFDLIVCTGVIHHMEKPEDGLEALASLLAPRGAIHAMVYAHSKRAGVYFLQDMFRRLKIKQDSDGVAFVRRALRGLPPYHYAKWFLAGIEKIEDAELVDIFLHPQDRAYSVQQVLDLVAGANLAFQGWSDNGMYYRDAFINSTTELWPLLDGVGEADEWSIVEDLMLHNFRHSFVARAKGEGEPWRVNFDSDHWLNYIPVKHPFLTAQAGGNFRRHNFEFTLTAAEQVLMKAADGQMPISAIIAAKGQMINNPDPREFSRVFYRRMWRQGHIFCRTA